MADPNALEINGVAHAAAMAAAHRGCFDRLTAMLPIALGAESARGLGSNLTIPSSDPGTFLRQLHAFEASSLAGLLRALPLSSSILLRLSELHVLSAAFASVRRAFGVNLQRPNGPKLLLDQVRLNGPTPAFYWPTSLSLGNLSTLTQFAVLVGSFKSAIGVDILLPHAGGRLHTAMRTLEASAVFRLSALPIRLPTLLGLQNLMTLSTAFAASHQSLGIDLTAPDVSAKLGALTASLKPDGALASALQMPSLTTEIVQRVNALAAGLRLSQRSLGLNLLQRDAGFRLQGMLASFSASGVCQSAREVSFTNAQLATAVGLQRLSGAFRELEFGGLASSLNDAARVANLVDSVRESDAESTLGELQIDPAVLSALAKIAALADAQPYFTATTGGGATS